MGETITYIKTAENDYAFIKKNVEEGAISNVLAYTMQNICERYLKGAIVCLGLESSCKQKEMSSHSLRKICKVLKEYPPNEISLNYDTVYKADGYYFDTRYPGDDYFEVDESDILACWEALNEARNFALAIEQQYTLNKPLDIAESTSLLEELMEDENAIEQE